MVKDHEELERSCKCSSSRACVYLHVCGLIAVLSFSQVEESSGMVFDICCSKLKLYHCPKNAKMNLGLEGVNV